MGEDNISQKGKGAARARKRGCLGTFFAALGVLVSGLYLCNPTAGVFELVPDNVPFFGNLDEAFFTALLIASLGYLGIEIPFINRRANAPAKKIRDATPEE